MWMVDFTHEGKRCIKSTKTNDKVLATKILKDIEGRIARGAFDMNSYEKTLHQNMSPFGERFELIKKKSVDATDQLANESLDFVLVDGDQTEDSIHNDIELYYPKIKKNGYIFGHDIQVKFVVDAIKRYRETNRIRTPLNNSKNFVWFWIKP